MTCVILLYSPIIGAFTSAGVMNPPPATTYYMSMRSQRFLLFRIYRYQDAEAYAELYDGYYERIRRFVFFKLPPEVVDEVTAEVFLRAWEYATASAVHDAPALFYKIARNLIADYYRKNANKKTESLDDHVIVDEANLEEDVDDQMEASHLLKVLRGIHEEYQEVLVMRYLDDMSIAEIASATGKTANNVRVLLFRAKRALKSAVGNGG